ncbi:MAG: hypothetical protein AMJ91_03870 [candidate division Zixibacteria bacterium SM23_73_3]|nr:MAG: hypothetical protein AMJ91_03870 [candidate division Zixibacteria bacterium SM23_73_3]
MDFACWSSGPIGEERTTGSRWLPLLVEHTKGTGVPRPFEHPECHPKIVIGMPASELSFCKPPHATWAESFIFAGSSALLLLVANFFPHWWYVSFFALTPFLYRIIKATPGESLRLGFLFGLSFFGALLANSLMISPLASVLKLLSGTALFALFGWSVGWARERWGFNPSIVALLWVDLEMGLMKLGFVGGFLGRAEFSHPFFHSLVGLFGFLAVSAIIVLFNSLLIMAIVKTLEVRRSRGKSVAEDERTWDIFFTWNLFAEKVYLVPEGRVPPLIPKTVCVKVRL